MRVVNCPRCATPVPWVAASRYRPFCSERCRLIDLGDWAAERYRVADDSGPEEERDAPDTRRPD
ncbi:MAG: DNA gyrase inhibitor YacG [Burkholderiales bacterium]|nr:DNA gyrase inhibitor YacG [Burkholderiales bacterium]